MVVKSLIKYFGKKSLRVSVSLWLILVFVSGCVTNMAVKPGYDFSKVRRIAVINFDGEQGGAAADIFILELMRKGFDVAERSKLESVLKEQDLGISGRVEPSTAKSIGKIFGVDAIITGSIVQYLPAQKRTVFFSLGDTVVITPGLYVVERGDNYVIYMTDAEIGISARMIDVETGSIVWVASESYRGFSTDSTFQGVILSLVDSLRSVFPKKK
jgi:curli biogenesis system outer membrane secretion channel CsgG